MSITFKKNYFLFKNFMLSICKLHNIKIIKSKDELDGSFFPEKEPSMKIPSDINENTWQIIGHEFAHAIQYINKDENLLGKFYNETPIQTWNNWLNDIKSYSKKQIKSTVKRIKTLELDAEFMMINFNRIFKLGLNEKNLYKNAYAYVYFIEYQYINKVPLDNYHLNKTFLDMMPSDYKSRDMVINDHSPEIMESLNKERLKLIIQ